LFSGKSIKLLPPELHSLTPVCTKFVCRLGLRPGPDCGSLQRSPRPHIAGFKGPYFKGTRGEGQDGRRREGGKGRRKERGRSEFVLCPRKKKRKLGAYG